jgi:hypothetical protein
LISPVSVHQERAVVVASAVVAEAEDIVVTVVAEVAFEAGVSP